MIQMVDLKRQYQKIKSEVDVAIQEVIDTSAFINGPAVKQFATAMQDYHQVKHVIPCANGTDALQITMMVLDLQPGDEVIVPGFTYVAAAEVIALLQLKPIMVDVDPDTFNITAEIIEKAITPRTKAIVPVHLFGQCTDMEPIMEVANIYNLFVIEDTAQAIGADYTFTNGKSQKAGCIGQIGTTSFFPSKNLGCYGDGGAVYTNDDDLAKKMTMIANHGQSKKYHHEVVGCNSRLDTLQAAILNVKLKYLDTYAEARSRCATAYDEAFKEIDGLQIPKRQYNSTHVFHQYTLQVKEGKRDALKSYLALQGVPSMIYYPIPLYKQVAFKQYVPDGFALPITEQLCQDVLSLPIHTEMDDESQKFIIDTVQNFFIEN
jgi:UDP-2-acetamido-2-deoxy-ribo-hexuluronate aminotransferase